MTGDVLDVCACGHKRGSHVWGFGRCLACAYRCSFFALARAAPPLGFAATASGRWRVVRFECGCTRYVDAELVADPGGLLDVHCSLPDHAGSHGVEVVGG